MWEWEFDLISILDMFGVCEVCLDGEVILFKWDGEFYESWYDLVWLKQNCLGFGFVDLVGILLFIWCGDVVVFQFLWIDVVKLMVDDKVLLEFLIEIKKIGLVFVGGMVDDENVGMDVVCWIGFLCEMNFGVIFEVCFKLNLNNLVYILYVLLLYIDLLNQELFLGFQFLYCLVNEVVGGGLIFCDGFVFVEDLCKIDLVVFCLFCEILVLFCFQDENYDICCYYLVI